MYIPYPHKFFLNFGSLITYITIKFLVLPIPWLLLATGKGYRYHVFMDFLLLSISLTNLIIAFLFNITATKMIPAKQ